MIDGHYTFVHMCLYVCLTLFDSMVCSPPGFPVHGVFRQEYWSVLLFPSTGDLPDPGTEPTSVMSVALADEFFFLPLSHLGSYYTYFGDQFVMCINVKSLLYT